MYFTKNNVKIITTQDEYDAFYTIRGICVELVEPERIVMRDAKSYCAVLFDDNNRMPVARLYFNNPNKLMLGIFSGRNEEKIVMPGDKLGIIEQYVPGEGTYDDDGEIKSSVLGNVKINQKNRSTYPKNKRD